MEVGDRTRRGQSQSFTVGPRFEMSPLVPSIPFLRVFVSRVPRVDGSPSNVRRTLPAPTDW